MISDLFRNNLKNFKPYEAEKNNFSIRLDANESFLNFPEELKKELLSAVESTLFNRYPDPESSEVCKLYADYAETSLGNIMSGNGSDELIQIIVNAIISDREKVMTLSPDFSMYSIYTRLAGGIPVEFQLGSNFELDVDTFIEKTNSEGAKLVFISNPNNPTGGIIPRESLCKIMENIRSIVVIDEAYYEFYGESLVDKINTYENLIILRTCSKAVGLAALRLGFLIANRVLVNELKKVKPPFNVNAVTQSIAAVILKRPEFIKRNVKTILKERSYFINGLEQIKNITIYQTEANFILIESNFIDEFKKKALKAGISVRSYSSPRLKNCLRVTVGNREENKVFIESLI